MPLPHQPISPGNILIALLFYLGTFAGAQTSQFSTLRLAHLSPDAPKVDLVLDDTLLLRDVAFSEVSAYLIVASGHHDLRVFPHRAEQSPPDREKSEAQPQAVTPLEPYTIAVDLTEGRYYTIALAGFFEPPTSEATSGTLTVDADEGVNIRVTGPRSFLVTMNTRQTLTGLEPGQYHLTASREGYQDATYAVEVRSGETSYVPIALQATNESSQTRPQESVRETTASEQIWHRTQLQLYTDTYTTLPPAGQAVVRFIHTAPGSGGIELYAAPTNAETSGAALLGKLDFPNATDYLPMMAGRYSFEFRLAGTSLVLDALTDVSLVPGAIYTFYLVGSVTDAALTPLPTIDLMVRTPQNH